VIDQGRAQLRDVAIGQLTGLSAQVVSGLAEGDELIAHPSDQVAAGARVAPR
jgi:HlyD family secretion protein